MSARRKIRGAHATRMPFRRPAETISWCRKRKVTRTLPELRGESPRRTRESRALPGRDIDEH